VVPDRINSPYEGCLRLQQELVSAFGLAEARVIPALDEADASRKALITSAAATARARGADVQVLSTQESDG